MIRPTLNEEASDGAILSFSNPATSRILGYDNVELVGRNLSELTHPDDLEKVRHLFSQALRSPG